MNKVSETFITLGIFAMALGSCKKDANSKVDCEIKVASTPSFDSSNEHQFRLNAAGQMISFLHENETYTYKYKANQVASSLISSMERSVRFLAMTMVTVANMWRIAAGQTFYNANQSQENPQISIFKILSSKIPHPFQ